MDPTRRKQVFVLALVIIAMILVLYEVLYYEGQKAVSPVPPVAQPTPTALGVKCYDSPNYFAVDSGAGSVLVKYKASASQTFPCAYAAAAGDFQTPSSSPDFFLGFAGNFLIIDSGTAPEPRGLIVYDLGTRQQVFNDSYSSPVDVGTSTVTYWSPTSTVPTAANCAQFGELKADGLGMVIEEYVTLSLPGLVKTGSGQYRCSPTQG
ncbi:MAG TPA: hypothetical protein VHZ04_01400 [Candidatus Paceibacterota bacterium]|nr:hypothetical protein [Candidatus Paceibacterota bacterium]